MPQQTILDLLTNYSKRGNIGSLLFQSRYIRTPWLSNQSQFKSIDLIDAVDDLQQDRNVFPIQNRSKVIVNPGAILKLDEHFVWKFRKQSYQEIKIDPKEALLYHLKPASADIFDQIPVNENFRKHLKRLLTETEFS